MDAQQFWLQLVLASLATWRVTHLLAKEDGPADLFARLRLWFGNSFFGQVLDCFYCLSLWIAAPLAFTISSTFLNYVLVWFSLSGAACLLERSGQEPVLIQPLSTTEEGGTYNGMLRSETNSATSDILTSKNHHPNNPTSY